MNKFTFKISGQFGEHKKDIIIVEYSINDAMNLVELLIKNSRSSCSGIWITNLVHKNLVIYGDVNRHDISWVYPLYTREYVELQIHELRHNLFYCDTCDGSKQLHDDIQRFEYHLADFFKYGGIAPDNKTRRVNSEALVNDTCDWVVNINDYFGVFPSKREAEYVYQSAFTGASSIHQTPFFRITLLAPNTSQKTADRYLHKEMISHLKPINIVGYIDKAISKRYPSHHSSKIDKLAAKDPKYYLDDLRERLQDFKLSNFSDDDDLDVLYEKGLITKEAYYRQMTLDNQPNICGACGTWDCREMLAGEYCSG